MGDTLKDGPSTLSLTMYRGSVEQLFAVLDNQLDEGETLYDEDDDDDFDSLPVVKDEKPLDYAKGFRKLGGMFMDTLTNAPTDGASADAPPPPKKKTGFFGIGGETVQLEGEEADGTARNE